MGADDESGARRAAGAPPSRRIVLRCFAGSLAAATPSPHRADILIGRKDECDLRCHRARDNLVSGRHARVFELAGTWWVEDLGSKNGTYLNGREVERPRPLSAGDRLDVGIPCARGSVGFTVEFVPAEPRDTRPAVQGACPSERGVIGRLLQRLRVQAGRRKQAADGAAIEASLHAARARMTEALRALARAAPAEMHASATGKALAAAHEERARLALAVEALERAVPGGDGSAVGRARDALGRAEDGIAKCELALGRDLLAAAAPPSMLSPFPLVEAARHAVLAEAALARALAALERSGGDFPPLR